MKIFISGGCKNGKSTYGEKIACILGDKSPPLYYVATMAPCDGEDEERIVKHRLKRKNKGFETVEQPRDIIKIKEICKAEGTFLIDSTTALLSNEMFIGGSQINSEACFKISKQLLSLGQSISNMVIVSDYICSDAEIYDEYTQMYRRSLAHIDKVCASMCDVVIEVCFNCLVMHKGKELFGEIYEKIV